MKRLTLICLLLLAGPALAKDGLRELCSDRPGLNSPACTVDKGHLQIEMGLGDWTLDRQNDMRTDTVRTGDAVLRYGIGAATEIAVGWTLYGHARVRDRMTGAVDRAVGTGDVTIAIKQNLAHPDGSGFALALTPYVTAPTGWHPIGAGDWGAGLLMPITYDLADTVTLLLTPELDAAVDEDRHGRHTAYGSAGGIGVKLSDAIAVSIEAQAIRDRDPGGRSTQLLGGVYGTFQADARMQFDIGAQAGLNRATPDVELSFGITRKF